MSLSISTQQNSYLAMKKLGKSENNQTGASSRTQIAQNLQSSSAKTTRGFTLESKKQSNFVAGRGNTPGASQRSLRKLQDQYNIRANQGFYTTRGDSDATTIYVNRLVLGQSTQFGSQIGMMGMGMTGQMGMLNQVGAMLGMDQETVGYIGAGAYLAQQLGQLGSSMGLFGGSSSSSVSSSVSSNANTAISNMNSAKDAASLKQAIEGAKSEQSNVSKLAGEVDAKQTALNSATSDKTKAEKAVSDKKQAVSTKEESVKSLTTTKDVKQKQLDAATKNETKCSEAYDKAQEATSAAQDDVTSAQNELNSATTDEAKAAAQAKLTKAQAKLEKAKAQEAKAKTALDQATKDKEAAQEQLDKATEQLDKAQKELETSKTEYQEAEKDLKTKENALKDAESDLDKAKQAKQDYDALSSEIKTQESRLEQLQKQEQEDYDKTTKEISDREAKVGNKTDDKKLNKLKAKQQEQGDKLAKFECLNGEPTEIGKNGEELRSAVLPSGEKVYYVGMNKVSEDEYNNCKA